MKIQKAIPTLLLTFVLSLTVFGCTDTATNTSGASDVASRGANGSSSNPPASSNNVSSGPPAATGDAGSNSNPASSGPGTVELKVIKYVLIPAEEGGLTSYYLGIVRNEGSVAVMQLNVKLLDDSGNVAGAPITLMQYGALPPGQSIGFDISYSGATPIQHPQFKTDGQAVDSSIANLIGKLTVVSQQQGTSADGYPTIEGEVRNDGDNDVELWSVNVVAYDAAGDIVDVVEGSPTGDSQFPAHSTAKYHAMLSTRATKATRFDVVASGENQ